MGRHEHHVDWRTLLFYGVASVIVLVVGAAAIWSFIERQGLVIAPEPLPKITLVTVNARSKLAASWISLLTRAELSPTLVPIEHFDPIEGVVVFVDTPEIPARLAEALDKFTHRGGVVSFVGSPPATAIGAIRLVTETGLSDTVLHLSEAVSPMLARLNPGYDISTRPTKVEFLKETPRMTVDARWKNNARAAAAHYEDNGIRVVWMGFDPDAVADRDDRQLMLLLRTAFRWVSGQPVSDGACGPAAAAKTLTPDARKEARARHFSFSVDPLPDKKMFSVRMSNRGLGTLINPTVKIWLPPEVIGVKLAGDIIMKRAATLTGVPEEGAVLVSLPRLQKNEERVLKLRIVGTRARGPAQ